MPWLRTTLLFMLIVLSGCQTQPDPTLPTAENPIEASPPPPSLCGNGLWPFATGAEWELHDEAGGVYVITSVVEEKKVTLDLNANLQTLACAEDGVRGLYPAFLGSGHPALGNGFDGAVREGLLLPSGSPNGFWDQVVAGAGSLMLPIGESQTGYTVEGGRMVVLQTVQTPQTVDVPAGRYEATPVRQDVLYDVRVTDSVLGERQDVLINVSVVWYFAEAVGPVRIVFEGGEISTEGGRWVLEAGPTLNLQAVRFP